VRARSPSCVPWQKPQEIMLIGARDTITVGDVTAFDTTGGAAQENA
jgi:hypothetical protein